MNERKKYEFMAGIGVGAHCFATTFSIASILTIGGDALGALTTPFLCAYLPLMGLMLVGVAGMHRCDDREREANRKRDDRLAELRFKSRTIDEPTEHIAFTSDVTTWRTVMHADGTGSHYQIAPDNDE